MRRAGAVAACPPRPPSASARPARFSAHWPGSEQGRGLEGFKHEGVRIRSKAPGAAAAPLDLTGRRCSNLDASELQRRWSCARQVGHQGGARAARSPSAPAAPAFGLAVASIAAFSGDELFAPVAPLRATGCSLRQTLAPRWLVASASSKASARQADTRPRQPRRRPIHMHRPRIRAGLGSGGRPSSISPLT